MNSLSPSDSEVTTHLDRQLAAPMFVVAALFLTIAGFLLPTLIYRPEKNPATQVLAAGTDDKTGTQPSAIGLEPQDEIVYFVPKIRLALSVMLLSLYLLLIAEFLAHWYTGGRNLQQHLIFLLMPFMRLSTRDHVDGSHVWVVGLGWKKSTLMLEQKLAHAFGLPMVAIALPVLPLIIVQLFWSSAINSSAELRFVMATATAVIWVAFVVEFVIMFSVTRRKMKYCKEHWINLLIVVFPIFGFLRLAALGSFFKLQQLAKTASVLRLRGLAIRLWRATISLGIIDRALLKTHDHQIEKLDRLIEDKKEELELLMLERERVVKAKADKDARRAPNKMGIEQKSNEMVLGNPMPSPTTRNLATKSDQSTD
jgi:voltage-gated potassium channel